jgi:AraC-like DNA-binding protein
MEAVAFDSTSLEQIEDFVSRIYSKMRIGAVGESIRAQITRRVLTPEAGFDDLDYSFDIGYAAEPPDLLIVCDVISSTIRRDGEGSSDTFGPGEQFLISRPGLPYSGLAHATRLQFTLLDPELLTRVAGQQDGPVRLLDYRPVSSSAARRLQRTIAYARDTVMEAPAALPGQALRTAAVSRLLAASVLSAYPNTAVTDPTAQDRRDAHPGTLRRAITFIEEHAHEDIGLADIAAAAFVTPRAVQLAFRRHLNTTPRSYLRRVRLAHAHRELQQASPGDGTTVTAVASRWGFSTSSSFSAYYGQAYGAPPSRTLRR